jgi:TPR repeat protein
MSYAHFLRQGIGDQVDLDQSLKYFEKAAKQALAQAQYEYGCCLLYGLGISPNARRALDYFRLAKSLHQPAQRAYARLAG